MTFQATVVSEQTRQLVTETLQQASRVAEAGNSSVQEGKEEPQSYTDSSSSSTESSQSSQGKIYFTSDLCNYFLNGVLVLRVAFRNLQPSL